MLKIVSDNYWDFQSHISAQEIPFVICIHNTFINNVTYKWAQ
jgi:hypothetical protein